MALERFQISYRNVTVTSSEICSAFCNQKLQLLQTLNTEKAAFSHFQFGYYEYRKRCISNWKFWKSCNCSYFFPVNILETGRYAVAPFSVKTL